MPTPEVQTMFTSGSLRDRLLDESGIVGSLAKTIASHRGEVVVHGLYDEHGARVYDDTAANDSSEIRELSRLLRRAEGPILELASGAGRLTLPLTRLGRPVTALEHSSAMLSLLAEKAEKLPARQAERLRLVSGDMADFALPDRFGSIVLGTASISLLGRTEQQRLLAAVRHQLLDEGRFWLSIAEFSASDAVDEVAELRGRSGQTYLLHNAWTPGDTHRFVGVCTAEEAERPEGPLHVSISRPALFDVPDIEAEIDAAGLRIIDRHPVAGTWSTVEEYFVEIGIAYD